MRGQRHTPAAFYPRERAGTSCTWGWVGPRTTTAYVTNINTCKFLSKTAAASFKLCSSLWFVIRRCHYLDYTVSNDKTVSNESGILWKKAAVHWLVVPYRIYAANLRKTMKNLRGNSVPPQALSVGLPHTNLTAEAHLSVYQTKVWTE